MNKLMVLVLLAIVVSLIAFIPISDGTGNGAPSGQHYSLHVFEVEKGKDVPLNNSDRQIVIPLWDTSGIVRPRLRARVAGPVTSTIKRWIESAWTRTGSV